nr:hypothetical protein [Tanacetum cinerariifolium]
MEILQDRENVTNSVQTFLRKFNGYSFFKTPKELAEYINTPSWNHPIVYYDDDDDDEDYTITITPILPTEEPKDTLIMGDEHLDTVSRTLSRAQVSPKIYPMVSRIYLFVMIFPRVILLLSLTDDEDYTITITPILPTEEPKDTLIMGDEHLDTVSRTLSRSQEEVSMENFKIFSNLLFNLDKEIISTEGDISLIERLLYVENYIESFPPSHIPIEDSDPFMDEIDLFLASDRSIPPSIDSDYSDSERDNIFLERLLHDDPIPLSDILDFSNVV